MYHARRRSSDAAACAKGASPLSCRHGIGAVAYDCAMAECARRLAGSTDACAESAAEVGQGAGHAGLDGARLLAERTTDVAVGHSVAVAHEDGLAHGGLEGAQARVQGGADALPVDEGGEVGGVRDGLLRRVDGPLD